MWPNIFYILGSLFFVSWLVFLITITIIVIVSFRKVQKSLQEAADSLAAMKSMVGEKLANPLPKILMTLGPILVTLVPLFRRWSKKK